MWLFKCSVIRKDVVSPEFLEKLYLDLIKVLEFDEYFDNDLWVLILVLLLLVDDHVLDLNTNMLQGTNLIKLRNFIILRNPRKSINPGEQKLKSSKTK